MLAWGPGGCSVSSAGRLFGSSTWVGVAVSGRGVQAAVLVHWVLFCGIKSDSSCICSSMNAGLCQNAGFFFFFFRTSSFTAGMFLEGAGIIRSQILFAPKVGGGGDTSKVQCVTGITIPDVAPNIKITLKFRVALL